LTRGRRLTKFAVAAQIAALAAALAGPAGVAAATLGFTLQNPSVSTVAYSDMVTLRGTYTCVNDSASDCPTTSQSQVATFSLRPSGGSTFTTLGTVSSGFAFTSNPAGCVTTCSVTFQLVWRSGRIGTATVAPGVYDIGLTTTIGPGQLVMADGLTITGEGTTTTYLGATSGLGDTTLSLTGSVLDHDRGLSPGTGIISPDANLAGTGVVTFELYDATNTTLVVGPVAANLTSAGVINGSPSLLLPAAGGTFQLRTTYAGNSFYIGSGDLDTITVAPSNLPPVLTVPGEPVVVEATSPLGGAADFSVSAADTEDEPDPSPTCSHTSGSTFPVGDTTVTCSVVDSGGLDDTDTFTVRVVDTTDPFVAISTDESAGGSGWFNIASNDGAPGVTVDVETGDIVGVTGLACTDNGVDVGPLDPAGDSFVLLDGLHAVECVATDGAGNDDAASAGFDVDQTAPWIVPTVGPAPAPSGWWNATTGAPTATFACSDDTSGLASCSDPFAFGEGADQSTTGTATDAAGNSATADVTNIDVDLTGPVVVAFDGTELVDGGRYAYLFVPAGPTGCTATDAVSGPAGCLVSGYAETVGTQAILGSATDAAGNSGTGRLDYEVLAWRLVGFSKPIEMTGFNMLRAGGTAQLKFEVFAGSIRLTSLDIVASVNVEQIACTLEPTKKKGSGGGATGAGGGPTSTTVEASGGGRFTVRWQSPDLPDTCWRVTVNTIDGSSLSATFRLR
jgi:hypothetical protein